jgi:hypothetical protein
MNSKALTSLSSASSQPAATPSMTVHTLPASELATTRPDPTWSQCRGLDNAAELNLQVEKKCAATKLDDDFEYATSFTRDDTFEGFSSSGDDAEEKELVSRAPEEAEESNADKTTSILIWSGSLDTADCPSILPFTSTLFEAWVTLGTMINHLMKLGLVDLETFIPYYLAACHCLSFRVFVL